jgi:lipid A 4'-phosphatase
MPALDMRRVVIAVLGAALVFGAVFAAFPQIDLAATGAFFDGKRFPAASWHWLSVLRNGLWDISILVVLLSFAALLTALLRKRDVLWLPARLWAFILALYVIAPGLLVNGILKQVWGRARPDTVTQFGGERLFSPFYRISDQCISNCSFVSGEGSGAMALGIVILVVVWHLRPRLAGWIYKMGLALAVTVPLVAGVQRVVVGRHFLSDAIFAAVFTLAIALVLYRFLLHPIVGQKG